MTQAETQTPFLTALWRGWHRTCPRCGEAALFQGYLRLSNECAACGLPLGDIRADDFPPYLTMVAVGHIVVPGVLILERWLAPSIAVHLAIWLPVAVGGMAYLLPRFKGAVVGWMHFLGLRGDENQ